MKFFLVVLVAGLMGLAVALIIYLPELGSRNGAEPPAELGSAGADASPRGRDPGIGAGADPAGGPDAGSASGRGRDGEVPAGAAVAGDASGGSFAGGDISSSRRTAIVVAAEKVGPAVVSISVTQTRVVRAAPRGPFRDPFFDQFFRDFYGERRYVERIPSLGSGVIVSSDGLVVTNEHVVREGTEIKVTLTDGRQFDADVVASQKDHDLAILQIRGGDLPTVRLGDSDALIIGEWAIAIGNPFGYLLEDPQPTVTAGVISALHRSVLTSEDVTGVYKDMIQTDAAINPGNSGGPLVNSVGEVIGINTFIITQSGGSMGMGFAIPINRVKGIMEEIETYGRIRRIWIGLAVQEVTSMIARSMGLDEEAGLLISHVDEGSPSDKAGLKRRDVIVEVNGESARNFESARRAIFGSSVGDRLEFKVIREGRFETLTIEVEEAPRD
jgi:serine protease Do